MKSSEADETISTRLTRLKKQFGVTMFKLREIYHENLSQIRKEYPELPEHNQKFLAYRRTATWVVRNYSRINNCDNCLCYWKGKCEEPLRFKQKLEQLEKLETFSSDRENFEKIKEEIQELEDKILGCRKSRTIQENKGYPMFKKYPILKKSNNAKKVNKPSIPKNQISLSKYCT